MAEYFWIQKNDADGNTIALENRCRVSAAPVAAKLHEASSLKATSLAKNQIFSISKLLGKSSHISILLKGSILEKDDAGRDIPFTLLKEFGPNDNYKGYVQNLPKEMNDICKSAGLSDNIFNVQNLEEICIIAQQSTAECHSFSIEKTLHVVQKNPKLWAAIAIIVIFIIITLFK